MVRFEQDAPSASQHEQTAAEFYRSEKKRGVIGAALSVAAVGAVVCASWNEAQTEDVPVAATSGAAASDASTLLSDAVLDDKPLVVEFTSWKDEHGKEYGDDETETTAYSNWVHNRGIVADLNDAASNKGHNTQFALNKFSDLSQDDIKDMLLNLGSPADYGYADVPTAEVDRKTGAYVETGFVSASLDGNGLGSNDDTPGTKPHSYGSDSEETYWDDSMCQSCDMFSELGEYSVDSLPDSFDWRDYGAVTGIKDQGYCGSCWAFSGIADVEGTYFIESGELADFSEEQVVSCDSDGGVSGCYGGWMEFVFTYVEENGVELADDYSYSQLTYSGITEECLYDADSVYAYPVSSWLTVSSVYSEPAQVLSNEEKKLALINNGPMSIAIDAEPSLFYSGGVQSGDSCTMDLNHGVLLIGWGSEDGVEYWTIKNSWSEDWGEDGYYRLEIGANLCGVGNYIVTSVA